MTDMEFLLISSMSYAIIGFTIGSLEVGGPTHNKCSLCRNHPLLYIIEHIFLWPIIYIFINRIFKVQKIIKTIIIYLIIFFTQKWILHFTTAHIGIFLSIIITLVSTYLITLFWFGIFMMPGFGQK